MKWEKKFLKSWAIVPRGTSKKKIWLGTFCYIFYSYYYETANFFMNPLLYLYQSAMTVSGMWWHLLSSDVFLINAVMRTEYCGHKWIKIVFYWIAGGNYWSAVSLTNPLVTITGPKCSLQIRGVIYQSAVVNYWSTEKIKMLKTDHKNVLSQKKKNCSFI